VATKRKTEPKVEAPASSGSVPEGREDRAPEVTEGGAQAPRERGQHRGYVVLARRYRPGQFEDVVGQQHVTRTLQNAIEAGRVHHAYLFTGSRGVGKTTVARILAKALNCDQGASAHPCDACASCQEIRAGTSVDVQEIDGASHTGVDDVRELRESVRYQPARCRRRIYIIDEVHMLSTSAFNALLKTLEEPPPHVVFIFATTEPHKIPATILSRCQRFDFKRVSDAVLVQHLASLCEREGVAVERSGLALIARASEGSVRDSLSLLDQVIAYTSEATPSEGAEAGAISTARVAEVLGVADRRVLFALSRALLAREAQGALAVIDRLFEGGQDLSQFAQAFLAHLRDLAVVRTCAEPAGLVDGTESELAELREQAQGPGAELLPQHFDRFARTAEEVARSAFPRLLLEMAVIEMVHAEPLLPLGDLLERLERLEGRLGSGGAPTGGPRPGPTGPAGGGPGGRLPWQRSEPRSDAPRGGSAEPRGPRASAPAGPPAGEPPRSDALRGGSAEPRGSRTPAPAAPSAGEPRSEDPRPPTAAREGTRAEGGAPRAAPAPELPPAPREEPRAPSPVAEVASGAGAGDGLARWRQLLERLEADRPAVASVYSSGRLLQWSGDRILLGYPEGSFALQLAQDAEKRRVLEAECSRIAGRRLGIQVRQMTASEAASPQVVQMSVMEDRERARAERARELREEAEGHPMTRALVEKFGAVIESVTTEADEP